MKINKSIYVVISLLVLVFTLGCAGVSGLVGQAAAPTAVPTGAVSNKQAAAPTPAVSNKQPAAKPTQQAQASAGELAQQIKIIVGAGRADAGDEFVILPGIVENNSDKWISAKLNVHLYDKDGQPLTAVSVLGEANQVETVILDFPIPPGGKGPFLYLRSLERVQGQVADYKVELGRVDIAEPVPQLTFADIKFEPAQWPIVTGKFANTGSQPCLSPTPFVIGYNDTGQVYLVDDIGVRQNPGDTDPEAWLETLAPGASAQFEHTLNDLHGERVVKIEIIGTCGPVK